MKHFRRISLAAVLLALAASIALNGRADGTLHASVTTAPAEAPGFAPTARAAATAPVSASLMPAGARVAIIRIDGVIYGYTLDSVRRRMDRAISGGATLLVFEFDTPGGELGPALELAREIKAAPVPTLAWIHNAAYSAGSLLATSCQGVVMSSTSMIGDCAPIVLTRSLLPTERAKALAPLMAEFRDNARRNEYNYALLQAMCMLGVDLFQIKNPHTGEVRVVNKADYRVMVEGETIDAANGITPGSPGSPGASASVTHASSQPSTPADPLAVMVEVATPSDRAQWQLIKQVHSGSALLTLSQTEAVELGLAKGIVNSEQDLQSYTRASVITLVSPAWGENLAWWLTQPVVRALLLLIMLLGTWLEFHAPGTMVGALAGGIALVLLIVPPLVIGMTQPWHLALVGIGLVLLVLEILPPPTFGALAVIGMVMIFVGLVLAAVPAAGSGPFKLPVAESWGRIQQSIIWMLLAFMASCVGFVYISRHFGRLPMINKLVLQHPIGPTLDGGSVAVISGGEAVGYGQVQVGDQGSVVSDLRPGGRADIGGQIVDVVSLGSWIGAGRAVKVVEVQGNRIVVDEV